MNNNSNGLEAITQIESILNSNNTLAKHGTNLRRLENIFNTGLYMSTGNKTIIVVTDEGPLELASYSFRMALPETSVCVIIDIPSIFNKDGIEDKEVLINTLTRLITEDKTGLPYFFIRGAIRVENRQNIWDMPKQIGDVNFIGNPRYYDNLSLAEQEQIQAHYGIDPIDNFRNR